MVDEIEVQLRKWDRGVSAPANLEELRRTNGTESEYGNLISVFLVGRPFPTNKVYVFEKKEARAILIWIDSPAGGTPLSTPFIKSLIRDVELALAEVLPHHRVSVETSTGLDLR